MLLERTGYFPDDTAPEVAALLYAAIRDRVTGDRPSRHLPQVLRELGETVFVLSSEIQRHVTDGDIDLEYQARLALQIIRHTLMQYDVTIEVREDRSGVVSSIPTTGLTRDRKDEQREELISVSRRIYELCRNMLGSEHARLPMGAHFADAIIDLTTQDLDTAGDSLDAWQTRADELRNATHDLRTQKERFVAGVMVHVIEDGITLAVKLQQS